MAGRFLFRKLSSRMSRSTSLLGAYASASAAVGEPVTRRAWEGGIRNLRYIFNGASAHCSTAAPNHAARYCNTLSCTRAASETGSPASGIPSAITLKPAFANPVGAKRTFSSTNDTISSKPNKMPTSSAEWKAKWASDKATMEADHAAWSAKKDAFLGFVFWVVLRFGV